MSPPVRPEKDPLVALRENLAYLKKEGASKEELQEEIGRWSHVLPAGVVARQREYASGALARRMGNRASGGEEEGSENILDRANTRTYADDVGAVAQSVSDAQTFGLGGLAVDALSPGSFQSNRDIRRASREELPAASRFFAGLSGGLTNPINAAIPMPGVAAGILRQSSAGALSGAVQGAAQVAGENVGTSRGIPLVEAGIAAAGGGLFGALAAPIAARLARGRMAKPDIGAAERYKPAIEADEVVPPRTLPTGPDMPRQFALDVMGPNARSVVRGSTETLPGRETLRVPFDARAAEMPAALREGIPDAVRTGNLLAESRKAVADPLYEAAESATKGIPVDDTVVDELLQSPMMRKAWEIEKASRPDLVVSRGDQSLALPTVQRFRGPNLVDEPVPDALALHNMKRRLAEWAGLDSDAAAAAGVDAIAAKNAQGIFTRLRDRLPKPYRVADDAYEAASKPIEAVAKGRMPWKSNPNPNSAKGEAMAIPNVLDEMRGMTPENRALVRQGKQFDVATRLGEGTLKVDKAMRMLADPQSTLAKELKIAGGPLRERIPAWGEAMRRQNEVLPKGLLSTTPRGESVMSNLAESAGPTLRVTAVRAFRRALGHQLEKDLVRRGVEDAAIARLATATPQEFSAFFKQYGIVDEQVRNAVRAAAVAASTAGRSASGGLLAPR